ncbi:hypothetical protein MN116_004482 [Schistosoma mekongi]|uniref:Uncharacterized protein n=1 Tax=Schistosoma mekongi TaxID=38744 RepID=A0AAE2D6S6_SCHME|nr:hypothetical protein MN116_004482 [Schistosoma mekongi]
MFLKRINYFLFVYMLFTFYTMSTIKAKYSKCNTIACERCMLSELTTLNECCSQPSIHEVCSYCDQNSETESDLSDCLSTYFRVMLKRRGMIGKRRGFMG